MAYSPKGVMDLYQIIKRWHAGYNLSEIARALSCTRKTVRHYVRAAQACGLSQEEPLPPPDELTTLLLPLVPRTEREMPAREQFEPYREEITNLLTRTSSRQRVSTRCSAINTIWEPATAVSNATCVVCLFPAVNGPPAALK